MRTCAELGCDCRPEHRPVLPTLVVEEAPKTPGVAVCLPGDCRSAWALSPDSKYVVLRRSCEWCVRTGENVCENVGENVCDRSEQQSHPEAHRELMRTGGTRECWPHTQTPRGHQAGRPALPCADRRYKGRGVGGTGRIFFFARHSHKQAASLVVSQHASHLVQQLSNSPTLQLQQDHQHLRHITTTLSILCSRTNMQSSRVRRARALEERQLLSSTIPHAAQHRQISGPRTTPTPAEAQIRLSRPCGLPAVRAVTQQQRTVGIWVCCSLLLLCVHLSSCSSPPPRPPAPSPSSSSPTAAAAMGSYVSTVAPAATAAAPPVQPTLIVVGSGLAGLTTALRFLQVRHSSHNEQFHFGHFHFGSGYLACGGSGGSVILLGYRAHCAIRLPRSRTPQSSTRSSYSRPTALLADALARRCSTSCQRRRRPYRTAAPGSSSRTTRSSVSRTRYGTAARAAVRCALPVCCFQGGRIALARIRTHSHAVSTHRTQVDWMPFMPTLVPNFSEGALHISFFMHPFLLLKVCDVTRRDAARCDTLHPSSIGDEGSRATNGCFFACR